MNNRYEAGPPRASMLVQTLGMSLLAISGWKAKTSMDIDVLPKKFVAILAPHTSNWDFIFIVGVLFALGLKFNWFGKKEAFKWPLGAIFKRMGGIPIERSSSHEMVKQTTELIRSQKDIIIGIAPEGTRGTTRYWKSGFYHIARQAEVPIALAFLDYSRKVGGIGTLVETTGDINEDMNVIRSFYTDNDFVAKNPRYVGEIALKPQ
jgi:1-acyl-sn-glycerol-3-phosphate acyltransferase